MKKTTEVNSSEPRIVDYQKDFLFSKFWENRDYDHKVEVMLLGNYFKRYMSECREAGSWLIDIGGSFGRLLPLYSDYFKEVAILDYAVNEFYLAEKIAKQADVQLQLVRANAYHLPLKDNSQTSLIAVRLVHHLEDPLWFFEEVARVLKPEGVFICHVANKNNLKNWLRCLRKFNFSVWRLPWIDLGSKGIQADGHFALVRDYHPDYIEKLINELNLKIVRKRSTSWLRNMKFLQKIPYSFSLLEKPLQWLSAVMPLGPSNWYVIQKETAGTAKSTKSVKKTAARACEDTFCLPESLKSIPKTERKKHLKKSKKGTTYWDFRYPRN